jgi:hypothetical protein
MMGGIRSVFRLVWDRVAGRQLETDAQQSIQRGTDPRGAEQNLGRVRRSLDGLRRTAVAVGAALGAVFGAAAIGRFLRSSVDASEALRRSQQLLAQQLQNTGVRWGDVERQIRGTSRALWETHRLTDGEVYTTLQRLTAVTGDYQRSLENVGLVADVAAGLQMDVSAAAQLVGRVMQGNTSILTRYGIELEEGANAVEVLRERFAGMAKEGTTAGEAFRKAWGDLKEALGAVLVDASNGRSIMDRFSATVRSLTRNIDELVAIVGALVRALGVAGAVLVLSRLRTAVLAANAATITFATTLRGFYVLLGPKGWLILGVAGLTEAFRRSGAAAREAARDAREAAEDFSAAVGTMTRDQLVNLRAILLAQEGTLEQEMSALIAGGDARAIPRINAIRAQLAQIQNQLAEAQATEIALRRRIAPAATPSPTPTPADRKAVEDRMKALFDHADEWSRNYQPSLAGAGTPQVGILGPVEPPVEGWSVLTEQADRHIQQYSTLQEVAMNTFDMVHEGAWWAGSSMADAFETSFEMLFRGTDSVAQAFNGLFRGIVGGVSGAVAAEARDRARLSAVQALEAGARAAFALASGNPVAAGGYAKSAAELLAAAAGYSAIAGGVGASSPSRGSVGAAPLHSGRGDAFGGDYGGMQAAPIEVHNWIYGFDPDNPRHQDQIGRGYMNLGKRDSRFNVSNHRWDGGR